MSYVPKISPNLLTPYNHALFLIDYESQMLFPLKSINTGEFRDNVGIVAGASKIFEVPTVVTTVAENLSVGRCFQNSKSFIPKLPAITSTGLL
jgi:hypothetical protein